MTFSRFTPVVIFLWVGFVSAISFMEAWLKFQAPGVTLPIGLGIGKLVFSALNKVEWGFAAAAAVCIFCIGRRKWGKGLLFFYLPAAILLLQTVWLIPALNQRAEMIIGGVAPVRSFTHFYYLFFEVVKLASLFIFGVQSLKESGV